LKPNNDLILGLDAENAYSDSKTAKDNITCFLLF